MTSICYRFGEQTGDFKSPPANHTLAIQRSCDLRLPQTSGIKQDSNVKQTWPCLMEELRATCSQCGPYRAAESLRKDIHITPVAMPNSMMKDYVIFTTRGDRSVDDICLYAMRDSLQWRYHWHRSLEGHYWKHLYVAFSIIPEDIAIPPQHLVDGKFRLLGNSLADVLNGLRIEKVSPDKIAFMEMCLLRQYLVQYVFKQEPGVASQIAAEFYCLDAWRYITANTYGSTMCILAARSSPDHFGIADIAANMTPILDSLSGDLKMQTKYTPASRENRHNMAHELPEIYSRYLGIFDLYPSAPLLSRLVSSGPHFVPTMDGVRERKKHTRFPMSVSLRRKVDCYIRSLQICVIC